MHTWRFVLLLLFAAPFTAGASNQLAVEVADPFLEMHTGPGKGYPIFFVVERHAKVTLITQRTDWYLVREKQGREGWVTQKQLAATLDLNQQPIHLDEPTLANFARARWQSSALFGDFGGASIISLSSGYGFGDHIAITLTLSQALGNISNAEVATLDFTHTVVPAWRFSPYFAIGTGVIHTTRRTTLVQRIDSTDQLSFVGIGVRAYLTRRFIARAEYHSNYTFTSNNDNEEIDEWKLGFGFFF